MFNSPPFRKKAKTRKSLPRGQAEAMGYPRMFERDRDSGRKDGPTAVQKTCSESTVARMATWTVLRRQPVPLERKASGVQIGRIPKARPGEVDELGCP